MSVREQKDVAVGGWQVPKQDEIFLRLHMDSRKMAEEEGAQEGLFNPSATGQHNSTERDRGNLFRREEKRQQMFETSAIDLACCLQCLFCHHDFQWFDPKTLR